MKRNLLILFLLILSFSFTGEIYRVYVDREFGFSGVRSDDIKHTLVYMNKTLNIKTGDSVEWVNMDRENDKITIISDNLLWENGTVLSGPGSKFISTFNSSGIYRFHTLENTRTLLNASNYTDNNSAATTQTYEDENGEIYTITSQRDDNIRDYLKAVVDTEVYPYQQMTVVVSGPTIGNGTHPVRVGTGASPSNTYTANIKTISVNARTTPKVSVTSTPTQTEVIKPLESYQEFTLFEVLKRWYQILRGS
jgi:hypothetical protein